MRSRVVGSLLLAGAGVAGAGKVPLPDTTLWHCAPAKDWNEALPIGHGRLGAMIFGGTARERLQLNEDSLWSGPPQNADHRWALEVLPRIPKLLFAGGEFRGVELGGGRSEREPRTLATPAIFGPPAV